MFGLAWCCLTTLSTIFQLHVYSWRWVLLVEETGGPGENHWPGASHWQTLSHNAVNLSRIGILTPNISGDSIGICKSNHHMITATTVPYMFVCLYGHLYISLLLKSHYIHTEILKIQMQIYFMCIYQKCYPYKLSCCCLFLKSCFFFYFHIQRYFTFDLIFVHASFRKIYKWRHFRVNGEEICIISIWENQCILFQA